LNIVQICIFQIVSAGFKTADTIDLFFVSADLS
jgi:hypothetical protein